MALAFGVAASGTTFPPNGTGPITVSITPTATAGTMLVVAMSENGATYPAHGTVTYNGNAMTFIDVYYDGTNTDSPISLFYYYIGTPDGAAHDIVGTFEPSTVRAKITAITVTGADSTIGASGKNNGASTTPTVTVTTTVNGSFIVDGYYNQNTNDATGSGTTTKQVTQLGNDGTREWGGTTTTVTAGSNSSAYTKTGSNLWAGVAVEVKPSAGGARLLNLLGVGT